MTRPPKSRALVDQAVRPLPDDLEQRLVALEEMLRALLTRPHDLSREQDLRVWIQAEGLLFDIQGMRRLVWFTLGQVEQNCHRLDRSLSHEQE